MPEWPERRHPGGTGRARSSRRHTPTVREFGRSINGSDSPNSGASRYPASMSSQRDLIEFKGERPELERPFLVVHLAGWTDSGVAGQTAMGFLQARWNARTTATFDSDELIDYRDRRPLVRLASGTIEAVSWSEIELQLGTTVDGLRDALLLSGPEPDFRWHAFADRVTELCLELGVTEVFGLGAFPAPSLHTDPVAVVSTSADPELAGRLETVPAIGERPQIADFVEQIRNMVEQGAEQRLPSGDEIADELERFLSQQPPPDDDNRM